METLHDDEAGNNPKRSTGEPIFHYITKEQLIEWRKRIDEGDKAKAEVVMLKNTLIKIKEQSKRLKELYDKVKEKVLRKKKEMETTIERLQHELKYHQINIKSEVKEDGLGQGLRSTTSTSTTIPKGEEFEWWKRQVIKQDEEIQALKKMVSELTSLTKRT